jgi:hypothetical protein
MPGTVSLLECVWLAIGLIALVISARGLSDSLRDRRALRCSGLEQADKQLARLVKVNLGIEVARIVALSLLTCNAGLAMLTPTRVEVYLFGVNIAPAWTVFVQGAIVLAIVVLTAGALVLRWQRRKLLANGGWE